MHMGWTRSPRPGGPSKMKAVRRLGCSPTWLTRASAAISSAQAPLALTSTGAAKRGPCGELPNSSPMFDLSYLRIAEELTAPGRCRSEEASMQTVDIDIEGIRLIEPCRGIT